MTQADWKEQRDSAGLWTWTSIHGTEQITLDECTKHTEVMIYCEDGGLWFSNLGDYRLTSITSLLPKVFEKIVTGKLSHILENNSLLPPYFWYWRGLETWDASLTFSPYLQVALDKVMDGSPIQLEAMKGSLIQLHLIGFVRAVCCIDWGPVGLISCIW